MAKKPYGYRAIDKNVLCVECGRPLKKNVVDRKPTAKYCYKCGRARAKKHAKKGGDEE